MKLRERGSSERSATDCRESLGKLYRLEGAECECVLSDFLDRRRKCYRRERGAEVNADSGITVSPSPSLHRRKRAALTERVLSDRGDIFKIYLSERRAASKRVLADRLHAFGKRDFGYIAIILEDGRGDSGYCLSVNFGRNHKLGWRRRR